MIKHVLAAVSNISPISKLAAIFYVIDKNENDLEDETKQQLQNMIKMDETQKESTVLKLLNRYSAWGIIRFFTRELGNAHVKEVRALVKRYNAKKLNYENLIAELSSLDIKAGDPLNEFAAIIGTDSAAEDEESHSSKNETRDQSVEKIQYSENEIQLRQKKKAKIQMLFKKFLSYYSNPEMLLILALGAPDVKPFVLTEEFRNKYTDENLDKHYTQCLDAQITELKGLINTMEENCGQSQQLILGVKNILRDTKSALEKVMDSFTHFQTKESDFLLKKAQALIDQINHFLSLDNTTDVCNYLAKNYTSLSSESISVCEESRKLAIQIEKRLSEAKASSSPLVSFDFNFTNTTTSQNKDNTVDPALVGM